MTIFGTRIERSKKYYINVPIGEYANRARVEIPVIVVSGAHPGKTFWVNGEVHGEEINGSAAAWELANELDPAQMSGTLVVTPVANPIAFAEREKISSIDFLDMDTTFPGNPGGQWTQKIAAVLFSEIKENADCLLNLHSMANRYAASAYSVAKIVPDADSGVVDRSCGLALSQGFAMNCLVDLNCACGELHGVTSGALDIECIRNGIPAFMAEVGPGGRVTRSFVERTKNGILNVMTALGILERKMIREDNPIMITKRTFLRSPWGGMVKESFIEPGKVISKGEPMMRFHYFGAETWDYTAPMDCIVINSRIHPVTNTGERIAFVGTEWHSI